MGADFFMNKIRFLFIFLIFLIVYPVSSESENLRIKIPPPAFEIEQTRSDPNRATRAHGEIYSDPIIDTHAHLYPPREKGGFKDDSDWAGSSDINVGELEEIIDVIKNSGVELIIFMPTPNDGIRPHQELGVVKRKMIRDLDKNRVKLFCGSNYITVWLDSAYHNGYSEEELQDIMKRLSKDMDSGEYAGVGEIAIYHFDKGFGGQNILEFPPNFEPFLRIVDLVAKKGMWLDLHAEPVDPEGKSYEKEVFGGIELLYQRNPNLKLIYSHTAMTNPTNARRILKKYPNIMMNIKIVKKHHNWRNLEPIVNTEGELYEDWAVLFEEMPERFMIGTDSHFGRKSFQISKYKKKIKQMRLILGTINPEAARLIAYENARKIFK